MKRILFVLILIGVVLALSSCDVILGFLKTNAVVVDGDEYELDELIVEYWGGSGDEHIFRVVMVSSGITWGDSSITGDGEVVAIFLISPDDELADGVYDYETPENAGEFEMFGGFVNIGADYGTMIADEVWNVDDGSVEIKQLFTDDFVIQMELELVEDEGTATADAEVYFNGPVDDEHDFSDLLFSEMPAPQIRQR